MNDKTEHIIFESETKMKIGAVTYIVAAFFDEAREPLPDKIRKLLSSEIENKIAHLPSRSR